MKTILVSILILMFSLAACAKKQVTEFHKHTELTSEIIQYLTSLETSSNLYEVDSTKPLESCETDKVKEILDEKIPEGIVQEKANKLWSNCLTIYSCSSSAKKFITENYSSTTPTYLSFMDYKQIQKTQMEKDAIIGNQKYFQNNTMNGLYLSSNKTIYLDKVLKTNYEACSVLYHELIHRHDPEAQSGKDNVPREFRAYYAQILSSGELMINEKTKSLVSKGYRYHIMAFKAAEGVTIPVLHSKNSVINMVSNSMDDQSQKGYADLFEKFPWENKETKQENTIPEDAKN